MPPGVPRAINDTDLDEPLVDIESSKTNHRRVLPQKPTFRGKTGCTRDELVAFAKSKLKPTDQVALESTTNAWPVVEILRPFVARIVVGNPLKTKAIAEAKVKSDKVDAEVLAQLLRCDYLPEVWQPDDRTRQLRSWITHRTSLMTHRSRLKNQVHADASSAARISARRSVGSILSSLDETQESERRDHRPGPETRNYRVPHAQEQRAVSLCESGSDAEEVHEVGGSSQAIEGQQ